MAEDVVIPEVGEAGMDVTFVGWLRQAGDVISAGDPIFELDTEKVRLEVEAFMDGVLTDLSVQPGDKVLAHQVVARILEPHDVSETPSHPPADSQTPAIRQTDDSSRSGGSDRAGPSQHSVAGVPPVSASPKARRLATASGLDLRTVEGTGPGGLITERDVQTAVERHRLAGPPSEVDEAPT